MSSDEVKLKGRHNPCISGSTIAIIPAARFVALSIGNRKIFQHEREPMTEIIIIWQPE
jgi:hypothetical protein